MNRLLQLLAVWWATPLLLGVAHLAHAQDPSLPPANLSLTGILDGTPAGPGLYGFEYAQFYHAGSLRDGEGHKSADISLNSLLLLQHLAIITKKKVLDGNIGFEVLLPVVFFNSAGRVGTTAEGQAINLTHNDKVVGDLNVGPVLQWFDKRLFGRVLFHRTEVVFTLPTGAYDPQYLITPGTNYATVTPLYVFTYFFTPKFSTSQRHSYTYSFKNSDNSQKSGQSYSGNYSLEYHLMGELRVGAVGYYLTQTTGDRLRGDKYGFNTKELVLALGPSVLWVSKKGLVIEAKYMTETEAENRARGSRSLLRLTYRLAGRTPIMPQMQ